MLEPTTVLTDYALAALCAWFGGSLWRRGEGRAGWLRPRSVWACSFWAAALAALAGGTVHGFAHRLTPGQVWALWRVTFWAVGLASFLMAAAMAMLAGGGQSRGQRQSQRQSQRQGWRLAVVSFGLLFAGYALWMLFHDDFRFVLAAYAPAMLYVAWTGWSLSRGGWAGGRWLVGAVAVSAVAALIQASGLSLHSHFNHNDLYHVVQMVGFWMLYRGGQLLDAVGPDLAEDSR